MAIATATPTVQTKSVDSMLLSDCDTAGSLGSGRGRKESGDD